MPSRDFSAVLAELAVESWRFANEYRRLVLKLDANEQNRFAHKLNYFIHRGFSLVSPMGA